MIVTVHSSKISGNIQAPASKSSMQRACALALLSDGETTVINPGKSDDDMAALDIIKKLGAEVENKNEALIIKKGNTKHPAGEINCGESGLSIRMFTPLAALSSTEITINGEGSLMKRPMHFFDEIFPQLGVSIQSDQGHLPIKIKGPLKPVDITIDGSVSSQFLTGLLMAYGKAVTKPVTIRVQNLKSKPYIDLTLQMMKQFGYHVENDHYQSFTIKPFTVLTNKQINYIVEADWSGAAFLLVAGALAGGISVLGLDVFSAQADKAILKALMDCGCNMSIEEKQIVINSALDERGGKPFHFDATDCPDLFPPLVALAAYCDGTTVIAGVNRLQHKESNRALTLQEEFKKMGVEITLQDDLMMIKGGEVIKGAKINSHHDHRIAMACVVTGIRSTGATIITDAFCVRKSYPDFYEDLKKLGVNLEIGESSYNDAFYQI